VEQGERHARVIEELWAYGAGQSDLGRHFARRMRMHATDSAAIVEILRAEDRGQPLTPARLAERIGLTSGATSILLNRLEEAGHVTRERGHSDRRLVTLRSTAAVHRRSAQFFGPLREQLDAVLSRYSSEELDLVIGFVGAVREVVDSYPEGSYPEGISPEVETDTP